MADDDEDFGALSPEEALRAALRRSRAATEQRRDSARPVPEHDETATEAGPDAVAARTPMIDRDGQTDDSGRQRPRRNGDWSVGRGNPFAAAPPVLPQLDSGAGMGFEINLPGRVGRRR